MNDGMMHKPLPASTQEVADVIGRDRALFLVQRWKRTLSGNVNKPNRSYQRVSIYIPAKISLDHELVRLMGWSDASKLVTAFRNEILTLATCDEYFRDWRNRAIRRLSGEGRKPAELAEWFEMTDRNIRHVLKEKPIEARIH